MACFAGVMPQSLEHRKIVGKNIRAARKGVGLTLEKLAEKADMDWTYISQVERGQENISIDKLARIAKALDTKVADLVSGA